MTTSQPVADLPAPHARPLTRAEENQPNAELVEIRLGNRTAAGSVPGNPHVREIEKQADIADWERALRTFGKTIATKLYGGTTPETLEERLNAQIWDVIQNTVGAAIERAFEKRFRTSGGSRMADQSKNVCALLKAAHGGTEEEVASAWLPIMKALTAGLAK